MSREVGTGQIQVVVSNYNDPSEDLSRHPYNEGYGSEMSLQYSSSVNSGKSLLRADYLAEIRSSRNLNKERHSQSLSREDLTRLERFDPVRVSFVDRKQGVEYDANGQLIGPMQQEDQSGQDYYGHAQDQEWISPADDQDARYYNGVQETDLGNYKSLPGYRESPAAADDMYYRAADDSGYGMQTYGNNPEWRGASFTPSSTYPTSPAAPTGQTTGPKIPNYIPLSAAVALLFFFPIAIAAVSFAVEAYKMKKSGRFDRAMELSRRAFHLSILAIVMGAIGYALTGFLIWYNVKRIEKLTS